MSPADTVSEVGLALARANVALWLGPDWLPPAANEDTTSLVSVDWLGIWSEARHVGFVESGDGRSATTPSGRMIVEVPDRIDDVLGEHFSIAEICPCFLLNGKDEGTDRLSARQRRLSRDAKIEQLGRLRSSVLLIAGQAAPAALRETILHEVYETASSCDLIVAIGVPAATREEVVAGLPELLAGRVATLEQSLVDLLEEIKQRREELPTRPSLRIGNVSVPLDRFLRSEPPLDQDFLIVTEQHVRDAEANEAEDRLLIELLGGMQPPWRAMAHRMQWNRGLPHREEVRRHLHKLEHGGAQIVCLDIPAESGAGLTTLLQEIAFESARSHYPTFIHRVDNGTFNYDVLRTFLTDVYLQGSNASELQHVPAVLIFDAQSVEADPQGMLQSLPGRLARDGRRAMIIRGMPVCCAGDVNGEFRRLYEMRARREAVQEHWLPCMSAALGPDQQQSLLAWAQERFERLNMVLPQQSMDLIRNWDQQEHQVPLLICLYSILKGELRDAARLGSHLIDRLRRNLTAGEVSTTATVASGDEPLSGAALQEAVATLCANFGRLRQDDYRPNTEDVTSVFMALAALGCLRIRVARGVLADIAGVDRNAVHRAITLLEKWDLASTNLPQGNGGGTVRVDSPIAPAAFYTAEESIGLRHPGYGRIILDWLSQQDAADDLQYLAARGLAADFLSGLGDSGEMDDYPLGLLQAIFRSLRPTPAHVKFAEDLAMRYLRLQKGRHHEALTDWQWGHVEVLLQAFAWLPEQVVRQSASILHSRGITTYKSCRPNVPLEECRRRYQAAEGDFNRGIELSRTGGAERPVNIITSLGLLYLGWAEREREEGNDAEWQALDRKVEATLRGALQEHTSDNPFAAFGLARYLVSRYQRLCQAPAADASVLGTAANDLAEAIDLLQGDPEPYFEDEWNRLWAEAVGLLADQEAESIINVLRSKRDELGYALAALRVLGGRIPTGPTSETGEVAEIRSAARILRQADAASLDKRSNLAQLLRYAVFSADPDRLQEPAFRTRHELISQLVGSRHLDQPVWLFDFAMLAFQVGQYAEGADAFSKLRRGQRFFDVSRDRGCSLTESPDSLQPRKVFLRVVSIEGGEGKGWGRVEHPIRFRDPVPFSVRAFVSRGKQVNVGSTVTCYIRLNPAGPFAEPQ